MGVSGSTASALLTATAKICSKQQDIPLFSFNLAFSRSFLSDWLVGFYGISTLFLSASTVTTIQ